MIPCHLTPISGTSVQLDLKQLNVLSSNDPGFKNQVLKMLQDQALKIADELSLALETADWTAVANAAHKFKSSIYIINHQAHNNFKVLEKEAREAKKPQLLEAMTHNSIGLCELLIKSIEEELKK